MYIVLFITFTLACMTKVLLIYEIHDIFLGSPYESRDFSRVGRITQAVFCLHHLLPYVGNIGTIGTNGITNGTIGKTLNGICLPMVPFLPLEKTTNARDKRRYPGSA